MVCGVCGWRSEGGRQEQELAVTPHSLEPGLHLICRRRSHGNVVVEIFNLLFEELFQLRPLGLQGWSQQAVLYGEHLTMNVDVFDLFKRVESTGFAKSL